MNNYMPYMRAALEKNSAFGSSLGKFVSGMKNFYQKPVSTTLRKAFWTRAPKGTFVERMKGEAEFASLIPATVLAGGATMGYQGFRHPSVGA